MKNTKITKLQLVLPVAAPNSQLLKTINWTIQETPDHLSEANFQDQNKTVLISGSG